jgi:hypothetical protein
MNRLKHSPPGFASHPAKFPGKIDRAEAPESHLKKCMIGKNSKQGISSSDDKYFFTVLLIVRLAGLGSLRSLLCLGNHLLLAL